MDEEQLLALREVIREAIAAVLDDVKLSITEAIRSSLREEVPQALSPLAPKRRNSLQVEASRGSKSSVPTATTENVLLPMRSSSMNSSEEKPQIYRRLSAPSIARMTTVHKVAQRLKRSSVASPDVSEELAAATLPHLPRRTSKGLGSRTKPLDPLMRGEEEPVPGRVQSFLGQFHSSEYDRGQGDHGSPVFTFFGEEDVQRPPRPDDIPGSVPTSSNPHSADFKVFQRRSSSDEDASSDMGPRQGLRVMNSLEIVPSFTHSEPNFHYPPSLSQRVMNFFRCPRSSSQKPQSLRALVRPPPELTTLRKRTRSLQGFRRRRAVVLDQRALAEGLQKNTPGFLRKLRWPFSDPTGRPRQCWNVIAYTTLFVQLLYLPFQTAFVTDMDLEENSFRTFVAFLVVFDVIWCFDILMNFTTGFRDSVQVLQKDSRLIALNYLKSWFWLDFMATMPALLIRILFLSKTVPPRLVFPLSLSPILRLPRLFSSFSMLRKMEAHLKSSWLSSIVSLLELFMLPVIFSHLSACALWALGRSNLEHDPTLPSWIKLGLDIGNEEGSLQAVQLGERYMTALYFAVTVMSTVGLGDINMNLTNERGLLCLIMATTSLVVGVAVNGVAQIVSKLSERTAVTNEQLAKVSRFLKAYNVTGDLQRRVHSYLLQFFENQEREDTKSLLMVWLKKSEFLRVNVNLALTGTCLARHPLIRLVPRDILVNVCDICDMEFHPPGQELMTSGAEVKTCLYIRRGLVETCVPLAKRPSQRIDILERSQSKASSELNFGAESDDEDIDEIGQEIEATDAKRPGETLAEGNFIGDFRLFLGTSRSWKTATCLSFCELISLDVEKFRALMIEQGPEVFDILVIYSSIDYDCPKVLLRCLEEQCLSPEDALLFGEGVLHHCAKKNANLCADHLLEQLDADVTVLDAQGKTPSQVAAKLKHKEVFWTLMTHGGKVTDEDVLTDEACAVRKHEKMRRATSMSDLTEEPNSLEEVRQLLEQHGFNCADFEREGLKGLDALVEELSACQSRLLLSKRGLIRRVELVWLRLIAVVENQARALVELQSDVWRKSPDQQLAKLPCRRLIREQRPDEALRGLLLDLGVPEELLDEQLFVPVNKSTYTETRVSMSYPGLETQYVVHETTMRIRSNALSRASIGLPEGHAFEKEMPVSPLSSVTRQFLWCACKKMRLNGKKEAKTEEIDEAREQAAVVDNSRGLSRFNPLRFSLKPTEKVINVGAR